MGVTIAVTRVASNTVTGNQDITTTDLGGLTPVLARFILTFATADGTAANGAVWSKGAADGTRQWAVSFDNEHNQATIDVSSSVSTTACVRLLDGTGTPTQDANAAFVSFITNGVRINWTDAPSAAFLLTVIFYAGTDVSAYVNAVALGNATDNAVVVSTVGFEADVVYAYTVGSNSAAIEYSEGFAHNNRAGTITHRSLWWTDAEGADSAVKLRTEDRGVIVDGTGAGALDFYEELSAFGSSGFTATSRLGGANSQTMYYIALRLGAGPAVSAKVYTYSTPTATGDNTDSGAGFTPQYIEYLLSFGEATQQLYVDHNGGTVGIAVIDADEAYSNTVSAEDAAATSNTQSLSDDVSIQCPDHDGAAGLTATFVAFTSTGVTHNFSAVQAAAKWLPALAIQTDAAGASVHNPYYYRHLAGGGSL